jgi:hypothetical protein
MLDPLASSGRDGDRRLEWDAGARQTLRDIEHDQLEPFGLDQVELGDNRDGGRNGELLQNGEVFLGLRHDAFIGGNDEEGQVDSRSPGHHGPDEILVPGHIHYSCYSSTSELERGEVKIDSDLAAALLCEAVHRGSGKCGHQTGLAVVDVAGGADDHAAAQQR